MVNPDVLYTKRLAPADWYQFRRAFPEATIVDLRTYRLSTQREEWLLVYYI